MNINLIDLFLKNRYKSSLSKPIIIAHRGASGYKPENTLSSFKYALDLGAFAMELDVFLCKAKSEQESPVVVIHDNTIDRTTNGHGFVSEITLKQLQSYDAGNGEHIPLLSEVLDLLNKEPMKNYLIVNIELKGPNTAQAVANIIKHYIQYQNWAPKNFIISSFDHDKIQEFQHYIPEIKTGAIFFKSDKDVIKITQKTNANYLILDYQSVTHNLITKAHSRGIFIFAYTVNDVAIAEELATWQIDGIITDYPDILSSSQFDPNVLH